MREDVPYVGDAIPIFELGNVDCEDVDLPEGLIRIEPYTTGRINYLGDGEFDESWPITGLIVTVRDDKFVDFYLTDEVTFCIGAVIVKGGNGAMIYTYPEGTRGDIGLTSPINASGDPADLSNLTFCFVECTNQPEIVIALKTFTEQKVYEGSVNWAWAVSGGIGSDVNLWGIGYNIFNYGQVNTYPLNHRGDINNIIGTITATDYWENDVHFLKVEVTSALWQFHDSHLYVGPKDGFNTDYVNYPFFAKVVAEPRIFIIPFSDL